MPYLMQVLLVLVVSLLHGQSFVPLSTQDGGPLGPLSQSGRSGSADTLGDTDFVAWALRVAPECGNLNLHTPVGTTLAIAFMFSPGEAHFIPASPLGHGMLWPG